MNKSKSSQPAQKLDNQSTEVDVLSEVVDRIRELSFDNSYLADDPATINAQLQERGLDNIQVGSRHIEALVALGVLGRVISGGRSHLAWMNDGVLKDPPSQSLITVENSSLVDSDQDINKRSEKDIETNDLFKLDVQLDMEHEKLLLYRSLIVVEGIAGLLLLRQMLLWYFQL